MMQISLVAEKSVEQKIGFFVFPSAMVEKDSRNTLTVNQTLSNVSKTHLTVLKPCQTNLKALNGPGGNQKALDCTGSILRN